MIVSTTIYALLKVISTVQRLLKVQLQVCFYLRNAFQFQFKGSLITDTWIMSRNKINFLILQFLPEQLHRILHTWLHQTLFLFSRRFHQNYQHHLHVVDWAIWNILEPCWTFFNPRQQSSEQHMVSPGFFIEILIREATEWAKCKRNATNDSFVIWIVKILFW